jgi:F-type H+-transporting ATPase subunit a
MDLHVSVRPEALWSVDIPVLGTLDITNSLITMIIVMVFLLVVGRLIARRATLVPGYSQSIFELVAEFNLTLVESTAGKRVGRRIYPLVAGLFIFIIVANYAGLLPGVGTIGLDEEEEAEEVRIAAVQPSSGSPSMLLQEAAEDEEHETVLLPFLRSPSADLNMTLAMAIVVFIIVQIAGILAHGLGGRIKHMADPWWIFPIEAVSELSRIVSLSFRLFGNIFAGEVLIAVMIAFGVAAYGVLFPLTTIFLFFEVLIGFIQALVFAILTLIYIALAVAGGHDEEDERARAH